MQNGNFRGQNQPPPFNMNKSPIKPNEREGMQYQNNHNRGGYMPKGISYGNKPYVNKSGYTSDQSDGYFDMYAIYSRPNFYVILIKYLLLSHNNYD